MMDWKDMLGKLKEEGSLPPGEDRPDTPQEEPDARTESLRVIVDRKGRKGKTATIVEGFTCDDEGVDEVAALLKKRLGTGGSARGGEILIQGDRSEAVCAILRELGHKVRKG